MIPFLKVLLFVVLSLVGLLTAGFVYLRYKFSHPSLPKVKAEGIRIACVGDSITQGMGVKNPERNSYPALLQELLGNTYQVLNYGHSARTLVKSGDYPYWSSVCFAASREANPSVVLIMLGTNDSKSRNWNAAEYEQQLSEFVETYRILPEHPRVYLLTPCATFVLEGKKKVVYGVDNRVIEKEILPIVMRVAGIGTLPVIDIYSATQDHPEYFVDGVHPNLDGAHAIADTVFAALSQ